MSGRRLIVGLLIVFILAGPLLSGSCRSKPNRDGLKAAIIDQLYVLQSNQIFIDTTRTILEGGGFKVDIYQGDEITVDFYRKLAGSGYKLIIFRTHAGILGVPNEADVKLTEGTWLFTNEAYSIAKYPGEQLAKQLGQARIDQNQPWVFAVGGKFVTQSMRGRFPDSIIIMMGCSTLYQDDLAQALIQKSASAYLGWNATVDLGYVDETTMILVQKLAAERLTVQEAVRQTMAEQGADPTYGAVLKYYPADSGNRTVSELIPQ